MEQGSERIIEWNGMGWDEDHSVKVQKGGVRSPPFEKRGETQ